MPADLAASRLHLVVCPSLRLRDEAVTELIGAWTGPVKRAVEPDDPAGIALDLDTPSLFDDPALWSVRASPAWLKRHRATLAPLAGQPPAGGILVLSAADCDRRDELAKAATKADVLRQPACPEGREVLPWLAHRLAGAGVARSRPVAEALSGRVGDDVDALLAAYEVVAAYCGNEPVDVAAVEAVVHGVAERPAWEFTAAVLDGNVGRALELLHAGSGMEPALALGALAGELRKLLACQETRDDGEAAAWAGLRGRPNLFHARNRAKALPRPVLARLLGGVLHTQRQARQGGTDVGLALELLVLHAQRVVGAKGR